MQVYEIVVDGQLSADVVDSLGPIPRRDVGGATVLSVPMDEPDALARALALLETLGIGVTAVHRVGRAGPGHDDSG
jgi:hypothetical protein